MTDWLMDTLVWTAVLIGGVLLVRRPVARWFGPQVAYALWLLPMARLVLPPITLPAWMAPADIPQDFESAVLPATAPASPVATQEGAWEALAHPGAAASDPALSTTPAYGLEALPLVEIVGAIWLIGAAIFLWRRFASYFDLRDDLLRGAREVGRSGRIRLVETPGIAAPLAFGVIDPVIALPEGFMASHDRRARDLALEHEFAHHRGHDLLINVAVQPLFAMHWWSPLGHYGWLALRRDQEAACDARVVERRPVEDRAAYAALIAGFAAGPRLSLAAPMACPVLGDKSIIHRLRSLNMTDTSPRRRWTGRSLLGAAVLALPLTASIGYAASEIAAPPAPPAPPEPPMVGDLGEAPPAPPAPPALPGGEMPPAPPVPPVPPAPPRIASLGALDGQNLRVDVSVDERDGERTVTVIRNGKRYTGEEAERMLEQMEIDLEAQGRAIEREVEKSVAMAERHARLAERHALISEREAERIEREVEREAQRTALRHEAAAASHAVRVNTVLECSGDNLTRVSSAGSATTVSICAENIKRTAMSAARESLRQARAAIKADRNLSSKERAEALRGIDEAIREMDDQIS